MSHNVRAGTLVLFVAILTATLMQSYFDVLSILSGNLLNLTTYEGPLILKIGKDLVYFSILMAIVHHAWEHDYRIVHGQSLAIFLIVAILVTLSAHFNGIFVAGIGLRWFFPFLLFLLMSRWIQRTDREAAAALLVLGAVLCLAAQVVQLFMMPPVFGEVLPGVPARVPGIFIAPNSTAFFGCATASLVAALTGVRHRAFKASLVLSVVITALSQSGTGVVVNLVLLLWMLCREDLSRFAGVSVPLILLVFVNLNLITGRDNYVEVSGGERVQVLAKIFFEASYEASNFGSYTNAANLRSANPEEARAVDSLIASWIGNFGVFSLPVAVLAISLFVLQTRGLNRRAVYPSLFVGLLFAPTTIIFEAFPMNLFIAFGLWVGAYRVSA